MRFDALSRWPSGRYRFEPASETVDAAWDALRNDLFAPDAPMVSWQTLFDEHRPRIEAAIRAESDERVAAARRLVRAEDALADIHAAWPVHTDTYDQHLRRQHAAEVEVVTAKAALRAALSDAAPEDAE